MFDSDRIFDSDRQQEAFTQMLGFPDDKRLLSICDARSGVGKSHLLRGLKTHCLTRYPRVPVGLIVLKELEDMTEVGLVLKVQEQLSQFGELSFPTFEALRTALSTGDAATLRSVMTFLGTNFEGARDFIIAQNVFKGPVQNVYNNAEQTTLTPGLKEAAREVYVTAFFADLQAACRRQAVVLLLDAYEQCAKDLQDWLQRYLLERYVFRKFDPPVRFLLVLAGQHVPDYGKAWPDHLVQAHVCLAHTLGPWDAEAIKLCLETHGFPAQKKHVDIFLDMVKRGKTPKTILHAMRLHFAVGYEVEMSQPDPAGPPRDLDALLQGDYAEDDFERRLLDLTVEQARRKNPALAEIIRPCAIPRRLDATVIGVLRGAPDEVGVNEKLLAALRRQAFVVPRQDGAVVYHDSTRDLLLKDWQTDPALRPEFDRINGRLAEFYKARHEKARRVERDWGRTATDVRVAGAARFVQLASLLEAHLLAPLLEALYHETLRSAREGFEFFRSLSQSYEAGGRFAIAQALLTAARENLERLPPGPDRETALRWLRYWDGRLKQQLRRLPEAEDVLRELLRELGPAGADVGPAAAGDERAADAVMLRLWALGEFGSVLQQRYRLREALAAYTEELDLAERTGLDKYNLPATYGRIAGLHWSLLEPGVAADYFRHVVRSAREVNNLYLEAIGLSSLAGVLQESGRWAEAFAGALEAFHFVRTRMPLDVRAQQQLTGRFVSLLDPRHPRLLDTVFEEALATFAASGETLAELDNRRRYVDLLRQGGQLARAEETLGDLERRAAAHADPGFDSQLLLDRSSLREDQGRMEEAMAGCAAILEKPQADPFVFLAALSNRGIYGRESGHPEAEANLQQAIPKWEEVGHEKLAALVRLALADCWRKQGRLDKCHGLLTDVRPVLAGANANSLAVYHQVRAAAYRDQARWAKARRHWRRALALNRSLGQWQAMAANLADLAKLAAVQGRWREAARCSARAHKVWRRLAGRDAYRPSPASLEADRKNAEGTRRFGAAENRPEEVARARDCFARAAELVPENFWYRLNLAYACAELLDWEGASQAVDAILTRGPAWVRSPELYRRLAEFRLNHAASLAQNGQPEAALRVFAETRSGLEHQVAFDHLAEGWWRRGDLLLGLGRGDEAEADYCSGLTRAEAAANPALEAVLHARLGFLAACRGDAVRALEQFRDSIELRAQTKHPRPAQALIDDVSGLIGSAEQYHALGEVLRRLSADPALDRELRRGLVAGRLGLSGTKYRGIQLRAAPPFPLDLTKLPPVPKPIVLEVDARLVPGSEEETNRRVLADVAALRQRIEEDLGVRIPPVNVRENTDLTEGAYLLLLHEVAYEKGTAAAGRRFCPDAAACRAAGLEGLPGANPAGGAEGVWLPEPSSDGAAGLSLWDPLQYLFAHLEAFLRRRLDVLFGFQEFHTLLAQWAEGGGPDARTLLDRALPDDAARLRLVQVLQGLLREGVPVKDLPAILTAFAGANPAAGEVTEVVEEVRLALRRDLPGNEAGRRLVGLPSEIEKTVVGAVQERGGKRFLALPIGEAQALLRAAAVQPADRDARIPAMVVADARLRPFVRRMLEHLMPAVPVLAARELIEGRSSPIEQIEHPAEPVGAWEAVNPSASPER